MSECKDCLKAAVVEWHGFSAGCQGCAARAVSRGPNYRASRTAGSLTPRYREELALLGVTHDEVKAARAADALGKERA